MDLAKLQRDHWAWVESVGWHNKTPLECLALIAGEIGEAANECRGERPTAEFPGELADIVLRVADLAHDQDIDLEAEIEARMHRNHRTGRMGRLK